MAVPVIDGTPIGPRDLGIMRPIRALPDSFRRRFDGYRSVNGLAETRSACTSTSASALTHPFGAVPQRASAASSSLNVIAIPAARDPGPLATWIRDRTVA